MQKLFVLVTGVAAAVGLARAEDLETLGLWTFNGENGANVTDTRETVTIPNLIERTDSLKLDMVFSTAGTGTAPLPTYTNDVQYAYLFDGFSGDNLLATCATSIQIKPDNWASTRSDGTWCRNHAYFVMRDVGAIIKGRDWTLEMIMHAPYRGGWTDFIQLGTNTANKSSFLLRTSGRGLSNLYSTSTSSDDSQNGGNTYPKYDTEAPAGVEETVYLTDDNWHHVALQWTESTKKLTLQVDYGEASVLNDYWVGKGVNLELDDHAKFTLFGYGTYHNAMPTVQAIRLTRGTLPRRSWMRTSVHRTTPETACHYRFDGEDQLTNSFCYEVSQPRRLDLRLWKHLKRDTTLGFFAPEKPFVKLDGGLVTNMSVVGNRPGKRFYLDCIRTNPAFTTNSLGESFTHEFFFNFATNYISKKEDATQGGAGLILAEFGGTGGSTDWSKTNWALIQTTGSKTSATASLRLDYYSLKDAGTSAKSSATFSVSTNAWHHFALTYDAPSRKLVFYIDYVAKHTKTFAANERLTRGTSFCPFGNAWLNQNDHVFGAVDEWRISRRALSPDEFIRARNGGGLMLLVR